MQKVEQQPYGLWHVVPMVLYSYKHDDYFQDLSSEDLMWLCVLNLELVDQPGGSLQSLQAAILLLDVT